MAHRQQKTHHTMILLLTTATWNNIYFHMIFICARCGRCAGRVGMAYIYIYLLASYDTWNRKILIPFQLHQMRNVMRWEMRSVWNIAIYVYTYMYVYTWVEQEHEYQNEKPFEKMVHTLCVISSVSVLFLFLRWAFHFGTYPYSYIWARYTRYVYIYIIWSHQTFCVSCQLKLKSFNVVFSFYVKTLHNSKVYVVK